MQVWELITLLEDLDANAFVMDADGKELVSLVQESNEVDEEDYVFLCSK